MCLYRCSLEIQLAYDDVHVVHVAHVQDRAFRTHLYSKLNPQIPSHWKINHPDNSFYEIFFRNYETFAWWGQFKKLRKWLNVGCDSIKTWISIIFTSICTKSFWQKTHGKIGAISGNERLVWFSIRTCGLNWPLNTNIADQLITMLHKICNWYHCSIMLADLTITFFGNFFHHFKSRPWFKALLNLFCRRHEYTSTLPI